MSIAAKQAQRQVATSGRVEATSELRRILRLPRRQPLEVTPEEVTEALGGRMTLHEGQTLVVTDMYEWGSVLASLPVGEGKTLCTYVIPHLFESVRPVLLIPGSHRTKTIRDFKKLDHDFPDHQNDARSHPPQPTITLKHCKQLAKNKKGSDEPLKHWKRGELLLVSYQELSLDPDLLSWLDPDLVMADECHALKSMHAACTRHFRDWREQNPDVPLMLTSGTIADRSLRDFAHLLKWTHGKVRMPVPAIPHELSAWARATDAKEEVRAHPGALELFLPKGSGRELSDYRRSIGSWIFNTPGCVRTASKDCNASMELQILRPRVGEKARVTLDRLRSEKKDWFGQELTPAELWRHNRSLALEFHYQWEEPGPEDWMLARSSWKKFVRDWIEQDWPGLTSEKHIANACKQGKIPNGRYQRWKAIEPTFRPRKMAVWHGDKIMRYILDLAKSDDVWVWVDHVAVGRKLAEMTGWPYFHQNGMCGKTYVEDHRRGPAILSIESNREGRNLQYYHRNIICSPPTKGLKWEQMMGRTHRRGQEADTVYYKLLCSYQGDDFEQALNDCRYQTELVGDDDVVTPARKLLQADIIAA